MTPTRPGWYPDPLKPETQERRWDGSEWTEDTREAAVRDVEVAPAPPPTFDDLVQPDDDPIPDTELNVDVVGSAPRAGRSTYALAALILALLLVGALELAYLFGPLKDDPKVTSGRPVLLSQAAERSAVDTAAQAAVAASARSYATYDEQVDAAAAMMTDAFAEEFRTTTDDAKDAWVAGEIEATADVVAQAVMTASSEQVEVLVFLNQFTTKKEDGDVQPTTTPFRLKITLIDDDDRGWLVSDIDAK